MSCVETKQHATGLSGQCLSDPVVSLHSINRGHKYSHAADASHVTASQITMYRTSAGIFTKPPPEEEAVATMAGLVLNCANSALYMANYNLVVRRCPVSEKARDRPHLNCTVRSQLAPSQLMFPTWLLDAIDFDVCNMPWYDPCHAFSS